MRSNGNVQDLRAPLEEGQQIQILTTRDTSDPDALYVLRHSTAHLLAEAVRRLYPGTKIAIGPPIENGFYYDFEFPEPINEEALERIEEEIRKELAEGRSWNREEVSAEEAKRYFAEQGEDYKVELVDTAEGAITLYTQGEFTDLCRGPHLQDSKPIKAVKLTGLAGAYWRGDEHNKQLTRIYGTAFYSQADLDAYLERLEEARARDHRRLGTQLDLFHLSDHAPGMPFWHPKGMVDLERARGPPAAREREARLRRGEDTADLRRRDLEDLGPLGEVQGRHVLGPLRRGAHARPQADELPRAHAPLRRGLRSYRDLPLRYAESSTLHRNERAGTLHGLLRVQHVTQDDAHIFFTPEQIEDEIFGCLDFAAYLYDLFGMEARFELSTRPENKLGTDEEWDFTEAALRSALERRGIEYAVNEGDGAFYGPKIDLHMTDVLGRSWQMGTIQLDSQMPARFGLTYMGADNAEHTPYVIHRALLGSLERFIGILIEHYGGAFPFWLAPVQMRVIPVGEDHRAAAHELAGSSAASASRWTSATRPSASGSATRRSRRSRSWSSSATRSRTTPWPCGSAGESSPRGRWTNFAQTLLRCDPAQAGPALTSRAVRFCGGSTESMDEEFGPLLAAAFVVRKGGTENLVKGL